MVRKLIGKFCVFLIITGVFLTALSPLFIYKIAHRANLIQGLYDSDDGYDVLLIGSSHMNGGLDPNVLWKKYGIASYNYATGGQTLETSYYVLKEALKKHGDPDVVAVDAFYAACSAPYGESALLSNALDNLKFSANKAEAIFQCVSPRDWVSFFFPVLKYHFRWSTLDPKDYSFFDTASFYYTKGFDSGLSRWGKSDISYAETRNKTAIPPKSLRYLQKFVDLSKQYGFSLVFLNFPADYSDYNKMDGWVDDCEALFNSVADFAAQRGVPFLDYCDKMDEIGLDFANDMNNASHLNLWGACKLSTDFGAYLKRNYSLEDRRSDPAYAEWNLDYRRSQAHSVLG